MPLFLGDNFWLIWLVYQEARKLLKLIINLTLGWLANFLYVSKYNINSTKKLVKILRAGKALQPIHLLLLVRQQVQQRVFLLENGCNIKSLTSTSVNL